MTKNEHEAAKRPVSTENADPELAPGRDDERIAMIRGLEKTYHDDCYRNHRLFAPGSWLHKPVRTVMELLAAFDDREELQVLDLGCGVGRNGIPIAEKLAGRRGAVVCVDLLESAIGRLAEYGRTYGVESRLRPALSSIEAFAIEPGGYDFIIAVSTLEHLCSRPALETKLGDMVRGTRAGGIVCIIAGTGNTETDVLSGEPLEPMFEINLPTPDLLALLDGRFAGWDILMRSVKPLAFGIERNGRAVNLATDCVTFAARNPGGPKGQTPHSG
ncbi:class I SAM-dependent methyltransferase [Paenibacillus sp. MWE-103]|uniref:Class I SAM-dependent methyltransferase n=1 Tax=Paenibacillus artemisiicola TaxID=1172618 RepID=A0ABS3W4L1_9BACL|nr:class I SAM-dependent methyltransferase [Paenibacillus artemisiicola]MBO7743237.1 class I SAM-dependent methyltransferase [Paenibacillus artemisiicola]